MKTLNADETLKILEKCGWQAWLCDTPVPVYESVHAGDPADPGQVPPDMVLMPKAFVKACQDSMVKVCGNSMADTGIHDGDLVKMTMGGTPRDGDIVVVAIGNDCTVKCYHEDDNGVHWLLPQNKAESGKYKAIRLDEEISDPVHLCGVVTDLMNPLPRISGRNMRSTLAELRPQEEDDEPKIKGAKGSDPFVPQSTEVKDDDKRIKRAVEILKVEGLLKHLYDYTFVMQALNETDGMPHYDTPQSFLKNFEQLGIAPLPDASSINKVINKMLGKFPNWTFIGKDKTETDRRNNVGRRFLNAHKNGK